MNPNNLTREVAVMALADVIEAYNDLRANPTLQDDIRVIAARGLLGASIVVPTVERKPCTSPHGKHCFQCDEAGSACCRCDVRFR